MSTGVSQFKTDFQDPLATIVFPDANGANQLVPNFYGGSYTNTFDTPEDTVDRYVTITTDTNGDKVLTLKLNALGGINPLGSGFTLQDNIDAFEAAFLIPLRTPNSSLVPNGLNGIQVVNNATIPSQTALNTLFIQYMFNDDTATVDPDTFFVEIRNINTYDRLNNVARIARALMNNKRDNNFIVGMIMLALLRDDVDHNFSAQAQVVASGFSGPIGSPLATPNIGPVVPVSLTDNSPHIGYTWPEDIVSVTNSAAGTIWFHDNVRERLFNTLGIDIDSLTWIDLSVYPDVTLAYMGITFNIADDPAKAVTAIAIADVLKGGIYSFADFLRGAQNTIATIDPNIQRGVFAHLSDTLSARNSNTITKHPTSIGTQYTIWENTGW